MGGNTSSRRVVVENSGGDDVVTISEAVSRRIKGQPDQDYSGSRTYTVPPPSHTTPRHDDRQSLSNKDVEDFYVLKLKDLQERNDALLKQSNEQFAKAVREVEQKFLTNMGSPVCQDLQNRVYECYQANPSEPLNCSDIVNAFTTCVDRARMMASTSRLRSVPVS